MKKNTFLLLFLMVISTSCKKYALEEIKNILKTDYYNKGATAYFNHVERIVTIDEAQIPLLKTEVTYFFDTEKRYSRLLGTSGENEYYQHCVKFRCKGFGNGTCISKINGETYEIIDVPLNNKDACFELIEQIEILKNSEH